MIVSILPETIKLLLNHSDVNVNKMSSVIDRPLDSSVTSWLEFIFFCQTEQEVGERLIFVSVFQALWGHFTTFLNFHLSDDRLTAMLFYSTRLKDTHISVVRESGWAMYTFYYKRYIS